MRAVTKTAVVVAMALTLSACSMAPATPPPPALSVKNTTATLAALTETNVLTGDDIPLSASVELSGKRKDRIILRIERSLDGATWTTVQEVKGKGPKIELTSHVVVEAASAPQFRATVLTAAKKEKLVTSSVTQTATVSDIKQLVRKFYYDMTQAYAVSTKAGIKFTELHDYPGFVNMKSKLWLDSNAAAIDADERQSAVPALTTISPDPTWTLAAGKCNVALTTPPAGRTYIVSVDSTEVWNGFPAASKADWHVTFLNGQLYNYSAC